MGRLDYKVEGLDCAEEVAVLKKVVGSAPGIDSLEFNLIQAKMTVYYAPEKLNSAEILRLIESSGMRAYPWEERHNEKIPFITKYGRLILTLLSGVFICLGFLLSPYLYLAAIACGVVYVLPKAYYAVRRFSPDMNLLMVLAIGGAIAIQQWFEGATVAFLFSVALLLEQWSVGRARRAISTLMELSPTQARLLDPKTGKVIEVGVEEVQVGAILLIRPGEKIPLDGVVTKGHSSVDQSPITGESMPVSKGVEDELFAGTLNEDGALECRVTKLAEETTLAKMIRMVEEARSKRSESEQWVEVFARYYTPLMLLFALLVMVVPPLLFSLVWFDWIYRGLVLLVIACPCALVISTPVSIVSGLTAAARTTCCFPVTPGICSQI